MRRKPCRTFQFKAQIFYLNSIRRQHTTFEFKAQVLIWTSRLTDSVTLIPQVMHAHWQPTQRALQSLFRRWRLSYFLSGDNFYARK